MSRRIEIELTSNRDDATFTWRAAGAREPRGDVAVATLPAGAGVGDTFRVEVATGLDGHEIIQVIPDRAPRREPERLELIGRDLPDDELVTSHLARGGGRKDKRRGGPGRDDRRGRRRDETKGREGGLRDRKAGDRRPRRGGAERAQSEHEGARRRVKKRAPRAPRLRPGHTHRNAYLETLADEQRPVADQLVKGGMPNLRQAIARDNEQRRSQGQPEVPADRLIQIAESIWPRLQNAEWHDRADAALAAIDEVDLRDLRSVVVAADDHAKTPETRALADELRTRLTGRVERAQSEWLAELQTALDEKRIARVLNLSSRPPKAGAPLPGPLADAMVAAAHEALSAESASGRWVALLDALAYSPIRQRVVPSGIPAEPSDELKTKVTKLASRLPEIAKAFGITTASAPAPK
jgi:hypothetical protein